MAELNLLSEIQSPDLISYDVNGIINEITDRIKRHPEWKEIWNGELKQDALYVIINIFAYLFSKNAEVANRLIRENFILLAKDPNNITNLMANYGLRIRSNTHSIANIKAVRSDGGNLTSDLVLYGVPGSPFSVSSSSEVSFEIYEKDDNGKIDYFKPVILRKGLVNNLLAYSGSTILENVDLDSQEKKEKFVYRLRNYPVIEDSLRVYYIFNDEKLELNETDSFSMPAIGDTDRFPGGQPYYKITYNNSGQATIIFGTQFFGGSFPNNENGSLQIFYRIGGGLRDNIAEGSITYRSVISNIELLFTNNGNSGGGVNIEDLDLAKFYAPMRVGRGKQIIDEKDALLALANMAVKHKTISPKYSILPNKDSVPILHYYNYIVPFRNFTEFNLPIPSTFDNSQTYEYKLRAELNEFLNLNKIHDGIIFNEVITDSYVEENIQYPLRYKPILSGSLTVSAYDHYDQEIDRLIYSSSYFGESNINDVNTSTAKIKSYIRIIENVFNLNDKNQFDFEMDGYLLQITIPNQINGVNIQYNSPTFLAEKINELIIKKIKDSWGTPNPLLLIPGGQNYITLSYNYFYYQNNYFYLNSPSIGINSSLKIIIDNTDTTRNRFLSLIKFIGDDEIIRYTNAVPESRKIFLDNSNFNYISNLVEIKLNLDNIDISKTLNGLISWPDKTKSIGPKIIYELRNENLKNIFLKQGSDINLEIYDSFGFLKDRILFENVFVGQMAPGTRQYSDKNGNTINNQVEIFKDPDFGADGNPRYTYFDYNNSTIVISLNDSDDEQNSAPYSFPREPFINGFLENSISDNWSLYDDGLEALVPIDGFGKKFNFIAKNFMMFPSPSTTVPGVLPSGWQYYYNTFESIETVLEERENDNEDSWYYTTVSYQQKTFVPRVDENGDPVIGDNGAQIIDEVWLPYSTTNFLKIQYDDIIVDTDNYRNIVIGSLIKPLIQVPVEVIKILPSIKPTTGEGNIPMTLNKISLGGKLIDSDPTYLFEKKAIDALGCGIAYRFEIENENTNSQITLKFDYQVFTDTDFISNFIDGDLMTYIIAEDETNSIVFEDVAIITGINSFEIVWNSINFKKYKLIFHVANNKTNQYRLLIDNIQIFQEPIDGKYFLEILTDNIDSLIVYKPETDIRNEIVRGQGLSYDISLQGNSSANLNFGYEITDGSYDDCLGVSIFGIKLINNTYTYTLIPLNDNYDSTNNLVNLYPILLNNNNNNKVSVNFNTSDYHRFRVMFHARRNQKETFQISITNIQAGVKPADLYNEGYYFKLDFSREKFNTIKCNYEPHPYFQEDESMGFLDILKNQNKRVMGVEPLLRKVNYNPLGMSILLTFASTGKVESVLGQVENLIIDNFSFNNKNESLKIGDMFSLDLIGQKLIQTFANDGLVGAQVTEINSLINESPIGDDYYFISPPILYENLKALENSYPNINGIANKYDIKITYLKL